jgi:putative transposase
MALSQSALLELVDDLKTTDASELMRRMLATMLQELIDAEASATIGALPTSGPRPAPPRGTGPGRRSSRPVSGT